MEVLTPVSRARHRSIRLTTTRPTGFLDLTGRIEALVQEAGLGAGIVNVQTCHTTTAIIVNEHEPRLLADFEDLLGGIAPTTVRYRHDRPDVGGRDADWQEAALAERPNGHAHCRALLLPTSACLNVADGRLCLGRWQRIFLLELDGPREREVSVLCLGEPQR
jgi:secondary thiamine-phosphate synthase enzyme